ncbi:glutathione S-transferase family protein [Pelomonas sp. KK5]|uniref:glutathione S-transferase family protein n=1 Tax=Pelomonas sp. KK5 TaxID=1855730 RepID=UPI00097BD3C8|nr:glutathione S-transferase family protein [Pelomonas sp. KK5]
MITLYHTTDARSFRALWLLEEMKQPYALKTMVFPPRQSTPEYLGINPTGSVPTLTDGDLTIHESAAILEFLAVRYPSGDLAVGSDEPAWGEWLHWLHFGEASLTTPLATLLRYAVTEPPERRQPAVVEDCRAFFFDRLQLVERALEEHDYLVADRFTAADISVGYALMLARFLGLGKAFPASVQAYWTRLKQRPGFDAAKKAQEIKP